MVYQNEKIRPLSLVIMRYLFVHVTSRTPLYCHQDHHAAGTIVPTKRDSDVIFCLHLLSKK